MFVDKGTSNSLYERTSVHCPQLPRDANFKYETEASEVFEVSTVLDEFGVAMDFAKRLTGDLGDRSHRGINRSK